MLIKYYHAAFGKSAGAGWFRILKGTCSSAGFRSVLLYRLARTQYLAGRDWLACVFHQLGIVLCGADISPGAEFSRVLRIPHPVGVVVGGKVFAGSRVTVMQAVSIGGDRGRSSSDGSTQPRLGDGVFLGAGAIVIGPLEVGARSVVGAGSVVICDVESDTIVVGVPARVVRRQSGVYEAQK